MPISRDDADRARAVRGMFSAIAPTYDLLNRLLSFGIDARWRRNLVARLPRKGSRVLDLACGTGDVALEAAFARNEFGVFGVDFSLPMLRRARAKSTREGLASRILLQNASAEDLPFRSAAFDAVTMAFGIRNVVRRDRALGEIFRVLKPGGQVLILDFSQPPSPLVRVAYEVYFRRLLPLMGGLVSGNFAAYRYLPNSVMEFPPREEFVHSLESQGYADVGWEDFTLGVATLYRGVRPAVVAGSAETGR